MTIEEMLKGEQENIEYKVDIPARSENYMRTVVAYANANGGYLIFGIEDGTCRVIGLTREEVFQKMDAITNAIYDSCEPKITPNVAIQEVKGVYIIVVEIPPGMQRPYCIKSQEMTLSARNRSYDSEPLERELSEQELELFCNRLYHRARELCINEEAKEHIRRIGKNQLISYRVIYEKKGNYYATNSYQLLEGRLEDYPDAVIQCAVFKGTSRNIFITKKEFAGCLDEEIEAAYHFVLEHINLGARVDGLARQDIYELPVRSIREIIINAVCHRSYLCPGKVQVALFDDRLEVTSPGMLDRDLTIEKMKAGISKIRNGAIAKIFAYMNLIEAWGTGIPKLLEEAKAYGLREPELLDMGSDFRINLYRKEPITDLYGVVTPKILKRLGIDRIEDVLKFYTEADTDSIETDAETKLIALIRKDARITQEQMSKKTGLSLRKIKHMTVEMQKQGKIIRVGNARFGKWKVIE